jgi:hypothetical protein
MQGGEWDSNMFAVVVSPKAGWYQLNSRAVGACDSNGKIVKFMKNGSVNLSAHRTKTTPSPQCALVFK